MQNTFSIQLEQDEIDVAKEALSSFNWTEEGVNNPYMVFRMKSPQGSIAILYTSGKIVFQGSEDLTQVIGSIKESQCSDAEVIPHLGVDEVGKGDYFGPLVVASCFVDEEFKDKVSCLGFGDSKKFTDKKIKELFSHIQDYPNYYVSVVSPTEYNSLNEEYKNASVLLAKQHSKVIEMGLIDLRKKNIECKKVVIDQFSNRKDRVLNELGELGKKIEVEQFHKGESDIAVAVASVIARAVFLQEWSKMSAHYNFDFPKGASNVVEDAKIFVSKYGMEELDKVAKTSFKTTAKVSQMSI